MEGDNVEALIDRAIIKASARGRIAESCEAALSLGQGVMHEVLYTFEFPERVQHLVQHPPAQSTDHVAHVSLRQVVVCEVAANVAS